MEKLVNIIFDLDGTLIDSSAGILHSVELAFKQCNITLQQPLVPTLIGPPLYEMLKIVAGTDEPEMLEELAAAFKVIYDSSGYKITTVFDGVNKMLADLHQQDNIIYLLTNKRFVPTQKIIEYFSWQNIFSGVYALDQLSETNNKTELIAHVIDKHSLKKYETVYVGDTLADSTATKANNLNYIMAMWGYDSVEFSEGQGAQTPEELLDLLE